jgi:hypothetical protein
MATNPNQELIWQGRIHLGDEPGTYGDAHYNGICAELPITVYRMDPTSKKDLQFTLILDTEDAETYKDYPGHAITVTAYDPDPAQQYHSIERVVAQTQLGSADNNQKQIQVSLGTSPGPFYMSVRLRSDTTVNPGFYDDFLLIRLSLTSPDFYAVFGFRNV